MNTPVPSFDEESTFRRLLRFERELQGAQQGHFAFVRDAAEDPWSDWLQIAHGRPLTAPSPPPFLPAATTLNWLGWKAYHLGDGATAAAAFSEATRCADEPVDRVLAAMGLAKIATRLGRWDTARCWTIEALGLARGADRLFDVVRGYGALGEIMLRGGHGALALVAFGAARRLMPAGGGDRPRQLIYLATPLSRSTDRRSRDEAETLLMVALRLAVDADDPIGSRHALARLQMLELRQGGNADVHRRFGRERDVPRRTEAMVGEAASSSWRVAEGVLQLSRAFAAFRRDDRSLATDCAVAARQLFGPEFPTERRWAELLCAIGTDRPLTPLSLPEIDLPVGPSTDRAIVDRPFARVPLTEGGFAGLRAERTDLDHAWDCGSAFFL